MSRGRRLQLAAADLRRHWRHFAAAAVGVVLGAATLAFFVALGLQLRQVLLDQVLAEGRVEVVPRSADLDLFAFRLDLGSDALDEDDLEALAAVDGVTAVWRRQRLLVPALASGGSALLGTGLQTELVADGIDPELVDDELRGAFREVSASFDERPCTEDAVCGPDAYCRRDGRRSGVCRPYIPALVSPYVVELYNSGLRRAYRLPKLNPNALRGLSLDVAFGGSSIRPASAPPVRERLRLVGVSSWATPLGVTLPLGEVQRVHRRLLGDEAAGSFHAAILEVPSRRSLGPVIETVRADGFEVADRGVERAATLVSVLSSVLALGGVVLVVLSAAHVMHVVSLVVAVRRHELALLRAVGARRSDVRTLLVTEAAAVGLLAGVLGAAMAVASAALVDAAAVSRLPELPFTPETLFAFEWWLLAAVALFAGAACALGALLPARRAVAGDPAEVLAGR